MTRRRERRAHAGLSVLARLQRGLEALYRIETQLAIDAFVIDAAPRAAPARHARRASSCCCSEDDDELAMALFVDAAALANLERHDPAARLDDRNFADFCLAVEGRQPLVYIARCAAAALVSPLELELQAEVDKFVCCGLLAGADQLRRRLYGEVRSPTILDGVERERYRTANQKPTGTPRAGAPVRRSAAHRRDARGAAPFLPHGPGRQARAHRPPQLIALNCRRAVVARVAGAAGDGGGAGGLRGVAPAR